ncbi:MAG: DHH family phosphoesterase [Candidatus Marinimicrobia bacterium]|nr:DHH family phosphoesterase [Candidatus Neomarinimicrobiota bacterium]
MGPEALRELRDWQGLKTILNEYDRFVFSTHVEPDADGIGSELALSRFLKQRGKTVNILNPTPLRANLEFLPESNELQVYHPQNHHQILEDAQVFIAFDIGDYNRLKQLASDIQNQDILVVSIDHHPGDKSQFHHRFDFPTASSTGVLIYDLIKEMDEHAVDDISIAYPIYAAMMSDTGNFRFNNTDPETLNAAARLVAVGVKPYELYIHIYENLNTPGRLKVLSRLLHELKYDCDGRLAWSVIDFDDLKDSGVRPDDLHSLSDFIRSILGVEVGIAITKMPGRITDISMRSKGKIPVNTVAMKFGGGGHAFAAGCSIEGTLNEATQAIVEACRENIRNWDSNG